MCDEQARRCRSRARTVPNRRSSSSHRPPPLFQNQAIHSAWRTTPSMRLARKLQEDFLQIGLTESCDDLLRRSLSDDPPPLKKNNAIRHFFHLAHVVGGVEDAEPGRAP